MSEEQLISLVFDIIILIVLGRFAWKKRNLISQRGMSYKLIYFIGLGGAAIFFVLDLIRTFMA